MSLVLHPPNVTKIEIDKLYEIDTKLNREEINTVLKWVENQPHLPKISEFQAILFLQSCYYSIEDAQISIENYFTSRSQNRFLFECPTDDIIKSTFDISLLTVLPERTPDGRMLLYYQLTNPDLTKYVSLNQFRVLDMVITLNLYQYGPATGLDVILESSKVRIMHITKMHLNALRKMMFHIQEAIPVRIRTLHFYSSNNATDKFFTMIKPWLKKEVAEMLISHKNNPESLQNYFSNEFIPEDWGGSYRTLAKMKEDSLKNLLDNIDFFKWQDTQLVDESKRVKKSRGLIGYFWG